MNAIFDRFWRPRRKFERMNERTVSDDDDDDDAKYRAPQLPEPPLCLCV